MTRLSLLLSLLPFLLPVLGQDGAATPGTPNSNAGYNCDKSKCQLPNCNCASTDPPGGLDPKDTPMFVVFTADDAVQSYTIDAVNQFLKQRKNPNGCQPKMTYYTSLGYTNYSLVTEWFVAGNEIADHTMTHVGDPSPEEINGNLITLNALSGIPLSSIKGFRAPFLNYSVDTLKRLASSGFTYDSSASASVPVDVEGTDAYWPYTLDNGMANDCLAVAGSCKGEPKLPGFWEVPMYAFFDRRGAAGPHLMDPWLDTANGNNGVNNSATLEYMKDTFTKHYNGKRQPIGLYTHPIHVALSSPGNTIGKETVDMINAFLDWAQEQQNVWIVSTIQLLDWVRNPVPVSRIGEVASLKCSTPQVDKNICNGMPDKQAGLLQHCAFSDAPFYTCYGCPEVQPSVANPNPPQKVADGAKPRLRLPANCSTPFWDPIEGSCLCNSDTCRFVDGSRAVGPNGANLTGGGTGGAFGGDDQGPSYVPFNGATTTTAAMSAGSISIMVSVVLVVGLLGVVGSQV